MQDAINEIAGIMNCFPALEKIAILGVEEIELKVKGALECYTFTNAIELLEWCEAHLDE